MTSADTCSKCQGREFDSSGNCVACGSQPHGATTENPAPKQPSGLIEIDYSEAHGAPAELPQWRLELSRRLQEIKLRREASPSGAPPDADVIPEVRPSPPEAYEAQRPALQPAVNLEQPAKKERPPRSPRRISRFPTAGAKALPAASLATPTPAPPPVSDLPLFKAAETMTDAAGRTAQTPAAAIQELIDRAVSQQITQVHDSPALASPPVTTVPAVDAESKLILLSRTLSGLVDLIIIAACTAGFLIAADFFSGIEILDPTSLISYAALLAAVYLVYSFFFLLTSNQTIGMMITDLRLLDTRKARPGAARILARTLFYPGAVLLLGLGLLWGFFDRRSRCLHDILSGTRVTRLSDL
jgi:uncharacterized RDD family membrane protein YckC